MKSRTESEDPKRCIPYTDKHEPIRKKLLRDIADPRKMKSNTDIEEPKRLVP
jgi:hypothetical protein